MGRLYIVRHCRKDDVMYGPAHAWRGNKTLCGQTVDEHWYIVDNTDDAEKAITCKRCKAALDAAGGADGNL